MAVSYHRIQLFTQMPTRYFASRGEKKEPVKKEVQDFYGTPKRFLRFPPHVF